MSAPVSYDEAIAWIASEMSAGGFGQCVRDHGGCSDSLDTALVFASVVYGVAPADVHAAAKACLRKMFAAKEPAAAPVVDGGAT